MKRLFSICFFCLYFPIFGLPLNETLCSCILELHYKMYISCVQRALYWYEHKCLLFWEVLDLLTSDNYYSKSNSFVVHLTYKYLCNRDPFRPLWDISAQRFIYSLDWHPNPRYIEIFWYECLFTCWVLLKWVVFFSSWRCILTSYDDGTVRTLSLTKASYDAPVTGKPFAGTQYQGLHTYTCSPFSIWSIQVSRHTGCSFKSDVDFP